MVVDPAPAPPVPPLQASPPPRGSPPRRPHSRRKLAALLAILVFVCLLFVGVYIYFDPGPGSNCNDWYVYCPLGPGNTPIGTAFAVGHFTPENLTPASTPKAGCAVPTSGVDYCEVTAITQAGSGLTTAGLSFQLETATGEIISFTSVTLLDPRGNGIAQYTQGNSGGMWTQCPPDSNDVCNVAGSTSTTALPANLSTFQTLVLQVTPPSGSTGPSPAGDILFALWVGSFSGQVGGTCA
jgi:hypothetical protein